MTLPFSLRLSALAAALTLAGCANTGGIAPSAKAIDKLTLAAPAGLPSSQSAWPQQDWWLAYGDAQLDALMARALKDSPNLATAQARIARAQAAAGQVQTNGAPQVTGSADGSYGRYSENYQVPKPPLGKAGQYVGQARLATDFSWDLDLWDKNGALIRAAGAQVRAAEFDREAARLALASTLVRSYLQLASQHALQDILQDTLKQRIAIRELAAKRAASGLDTNVELQQANANEQSIRAELVQVETAQAVTRLQLAALAGQMPDQAAAITRPQMKSVDIKVPADLPLDLLGRRPELAAQRARIKAALGDTDAAKAQFYPNINLAGYIGFQSFGLGQILAAGSFTDSVGPALRLPLFDAGRLRANYAGKVADLDTAVTQYNQSVVTAAQDVAEQLTRAASLAREEDASTAALRAATEAHRLAMLRYQGGLSPYLSVLSVEAGLLAQRRAALDLQTRRQDIQINLVRALGGGFREEAPATMTAQAK